MNSRALLQRIGPSALALICAAAPGCCVPLEAAVVPACLTNAAQVRALGQNEAARLLPVRLRGVVLGEAEPAGDGFALQDQTMGIYVRSSPDVVSGLAPGDLVEVEGVSDPGWFAPGVRVTELRKVGVAEIPMPRRVNFEQLLGGHMDAQWVEISGIVRFCEPSPNDARKCRLELCTGGERLLVRLNAPNPGEPLVDAEVTLRGVCYYLANKNRQLLSPMLAIPRDVPILVKAPAPADPFATPLRSLGSLLQFEQDGSYGHRVHVRGTVIRQQPGEFLSIRNGNLGLSVRAAQKEELAPGDEVDVVGFPKQGEYSPTLEDAVFRKISSGPAPAPVRLNVASEAFDHDSDLLELEGTFESQHSLPWASILVFHAREGMAFEAMLRQRDGLPRIPELLAGTRIRVVGVCSVARDYTGFVSGVSHPSSFQLVLRSPADLAVVALPSWWTRQHVIWLLSAIAAASLLAVAGVMRLARQRLKEQTLHRTTAEAQFSAILKERNRLAAEVHDTLAQGLGAISMQLELAKDRLKSAPEKAGKHVEFAHALVRSSLAEARDAIWNMHSQVLKTGDLTSALTGVLNKLTEDRGVSARFEVVGSSRRLPPASENAVLRIGQEAITNALKHAKPSCIEVKLEFQERHVCLAVRDDGVGFETGKPASNGESFGLIGMRNRAEVLGGEIRLKSHAGQGTELKLILPAS